MKAKSFGILIVLLVAVGALTALFLTHNRNARTPELRMGSPLISGLDVNRVLSIVVHVPGNTFHVIKGAGGWQVKERNNYPADFDKVSGFLIKLTDLKVGRAFDGTPDVLARLRLENPGSDAPEKDRGSLFEAKDAQGQVLAAVLAGKDRTTKKNGYPYPDGQYLKLPNDGRVFLVDRFFETLDQLPSEWLKKDIIRIPEKDVESITCRDVSGEREKVVYSLFREKKEDKLRPDVFPPGAALKEMEGSRLLGALSNLTLEDVEKVPEGTPPLPEIFLEYRLFDGTFCRVYKLDQGPNGCRVRLETGFATPLNDSDTEAVKAAIAKADSLNKQLAPWIFSIAKWRCDTFITDPAKLADPEESMGP